MTDREIIEHLATDVMGWAVIDFYAEDRREDQFPRLVQQIVLDKWWLREHADGPNQGRAWNPLESIADAFEVQAAILDGPRANDYVLRIYDSAVKGLTVIGMQKLYRAMLTASARQRCLAAVEATR